MKTENQTSLSEDSKYNEKGLKQLEQLYAKYRLLAEVDLKDLEYKEEKYDDMFENKHSAVGKAIRKNEAKPIKYLMAH